MDYLKDVSFFQNMNDTALDKIKEISVGLEIEGGNVVFYEGDLPKYLHVLIEGVVKLYKTDPKGHQVYIHQFTPISLIGELANFENIPFPATAEAITKVKILKIDYSKLSEDFFKNPSASLEIIKSLSKKVKILSNVIHQETILTTEAKVAKLIIEHKELFSEIKNSKIAALINITPETLSRTLTKFKKQNYIKTDSKHKIIILDEESLKKLYTL